MVQVKSHQATAIYLSYSLFIYTVTFFFWTVFCSLLPPSSSHIFWNSGSSSISSLSSGHYSSYLFCASASTPRQSFFSSSS